MCARRARPTEAAPYPLDIARPFPVCRNNTGGIWAIDVFSGVAPHRSGTAPRCGAPPHRLFARATFYFGLMRCCALPRRSTRRVGAPGAMAGPRAHSPRGVADTRFAPTFRCRVRPGARRTAARRRVLRSTSPPEPSNSTRTVPLT